MFIAADLTNGGIAGVARGVQQAARTIGWPLRILDGQASAAGHRRALQAAIDLKPGGIILGGFDASEQRAPPAARARTEDSRGRLACRDRGQGRTGGTAC